MAGALVPIRRAGKHLTSRLTEHRPRGLQRKFLSLGRIKCSEPYGPAGTPTILHNSRSLHRHKYPKNWRSGSLYREMRSKGHSEGRRRWRGLTHSIPRICPADGTPVQATITALGGGLGAYA